MSDQVYRNLQKRLDTHPVGFAASANNADIKLLKHIFTPEQAELMCRLGWHYRSTADLYAHVADLVGSQVKLGQILHDILKKGGVFYRKEDDQETWAIAPLIVGMYEWQIDRLTPTMLNDFHDYGSSPKTTPPPKERPWQMRVIPIEKSVAQDLLIGNFDEIRNHVKSAGDSIASLECICRKTHSMSGDACSHTSRKNTCMAFHYWAEQTIAQGTGRRISQEEALAVLAENQKEGLVLMPSNSKTAEFVCSCCSDCCGPLSGLRASERPSEEALTNYRAKIDEQACIGCGSCAEACPMEAITVDEDFAQINELRCIGCGVCVAQCDSEAAQLTRKPQEIQPPATMDDLYEEYHQLRQQ